ncbi:PfkB family carbohydrate kinase [Brachyspira hyodysenteriae]|uniref:carbohydrate kinase family protein n=1 Tax=Brachyspira hyodysenteriae TaxID=159 RepID=UPI0022CD282E|nr:PfkB family carbohydrate kinase [Brachyspira hyodysenteriae]MCZ9838553.1 PfkB family carbohydrate kinase [Brachyspira hyodysenteriae]MCZ9847854.1 PfkB family carbohydrate kinase [Brachyspira hyodysenteriae]MCZ9851718.1 PfkB family carbohydrate kinase [Brachyspira hyodysenteriae]MCZ9859543.1 PfkB family carbohydrate kinase [Brachyspira hyodysenteriae]MCZ9870147.1 PfkB family carbohydrate kinase [Brachyspira hyodysenteriae]
MFKIVSFGELLYDVYDNVSVIGGAPFNYSLQLSRLLNKDDKLKFITALGDDDYSKDAVSFIDNENIDKSLIQILKDYDTGKATVFLNEKKIPDYIIHENAAWDNIEYNNDIENALKENYDLFYFNILSQRNEKSYNTLKTIFKNINAKYRVCDVTFRKNYYTKEKIKESLEFINILKINDDELAVIKELFYPSLQNDNEVLLKAINKDFNIDYIFLTLGAAGASVLYNNEYIFNLSKKVNVIDTVGAGDSFCAALSYAILRGLDINNILKFASSVSEEMVKVKGGTARYNIEKVKSQFNL